MIPISNIDKSIKCSFKKNIKDWLGIKERFECSSPAVYVNNHGQHFCRHHSKMGRYIIRNGDVGEILARFDTEEQLRETFSNYPGMIMQKISKSSRKDIF